MMTCRRSRDRAVQSEGRRAIGARTHDPYAGSNTGWPARRRGGAYPRDADVPGLSPKAPSYLSDTLGRMGFLEGHGKVFPQKNVTIIHNEGEANEQRTESRAIVQSKSAQFNVDTPIYEGDLVEVPDPRGGVQRLYAAEVRVNDVDGSATFRGMAHINVKWGKPPAPRQVSPVLNISGGTNQIAWDNRDVSQSQTVAATDLGAVLGRVLAEAEANLAGEDRDLAVECAREALSAVEAGEPAPRRTLATLKGVLSDVATGAARGLGQSASGWAQGVLGRVD